MQTQLAHERQTAATYLRYSSLFHEGRALSFPCDECGNVNLDRLSPRERDNYFLARSLIGRDFACPVVERVLH
jgi:hypothetical protein